MSKSALSCFWYFDTEERGDFREFTPWEFDVWVGMQLIEGRNSIYEVSL